MMLFVWGFPFLKESLKALFIRIIQTHATDEVVPDSLLLFCIHEGIHIFVRVTSEFPRTGNFQVSRSSHKRDGIVQVLFSSNLGHSKIRKQLPFDFFWGQFPLLYKNETSVNWHSTLKIHQHSQIRNFPHKTNKIPKNPRKTYL